MPSKSIQMTLTIGLLLNAQNRLPLPSFPNSSGVVPKCILTRLNHFTLSHYGYFWTQTPF